MRPQVGTADLADNRSSDIGDLKSEGQALRMRMRPEEGKEGGTGKGLSFEVRWEEGERVAAVRPEEGEVRLDLLDVASSSQDIEPGGGNNTNQEMLFALAVPVQHQHGDILSPQETQLIPIRPGQETGLELLEDI